MEKQISLFGVELKDNELEKIKAETLCPLIVCEKVKDKIVERARIKPKKVGIIRIHEMNFSTSVSEEDGFGRIFKAGEKGISIGFDGYQEGQSCAYTMKELEEKSVEARVQEIKEHYTKLGEYDYSFKVVDERVKQEKIMPEIAKKPEIAIVQEVVKEKKGIYTKDSYFFDFRMWEKPYDLENELRAILERNHNNNSGNACFQIRESNLSFEELVKYFREFEMDAVKNIAEVWMKDFNLKYFKDYGEENFKKTYESYALQMKYLIEKKVVLTMKSYDEIVKKIKEEEKADVDKQIEIKSGELKELLKQKFGFEVTIKVMEKGK